MSKKIEHLGKGIGLIIPFLAFQFSLANELKPNHHEKSFHAVPLSPVSLSPAIERQFYFIEKNIVEAAEAMPEDKFDFTPEALSIKNSEFKDVRSFAGQVKHLATDNFAIWTPLLGEPLRSDITDVNGPANIKTKADIIKYLKESFALGHRAIATLTDKNAMETILFRGNNLPRLDLAFYALTHSNEHYGQMVVYLRSAPPVTPRRSARAGASPTRRMRSRI